jgi:hypothetical protein
MHVLCAWCQEEGGPASMEERAYGICSSHRLALLLGRYLRTLTMESTR